VRRQLHRGLVAQRRDGFKQWPGLHHVVTVWRNFDPATPYKICNKYTGKCLEVSGGSTADTAAVVQRAYSAASNQKWTITQVSAQKYKVVNVKSGKALDVTGGRTADGTPLIQYTYKGAANQLWAFTSLTDQPGYYEISPTSKSSATIAPAGASTSDGTAVQEITYNTADYQKWTVTPG